MQKEFIGKYINDMCGIYLVENPLGEVYIGQSCNIPRRVRSLKIAHNTPGKLKWSMFVHGRETHKFYLLCALPPDASFTALDHFEKLYIRQYKKDGYTVLNVTEGGSGDMYRPAKKEKATSHWDI